MALTRILFVCLGNICRSPTAEAVLRDLLTREAPDLSVEIDSAGIGDWHIGEPPDQRALVAARRRGLDMSRLRARQIASEDFARFDFILAMDRANLSDLRRRAPAQYRERVRLFLEFAPDVGVDEVPDPYYGGAAGFEEVLDLAEQAARGLLSHIRERR
jgi:low molecular weight protein-tyrosine phosphatase